MNKVSIIIVAYNRLDMLSKCLNAVRKNTDYPYELILIDNGSDLETADFIQQQAEHNDVKCVYRFKKNEGFAQGYSKGLNIAGQYYRVILNDDTRPYPYWLSRIMEIAQKYPAAGLILPYTNYACNPNIVCKEEDWRETTTHLLSPNEDVPAVCWTISKPCWQATCKIIARLKGGNNFFHNDFEYGWAEDILTSQIIRKLDYERYVVGGSFIFHYGMSTQKILTGADNYRTRNMAKLKKYLEMLKQIEVK